MLKKSGSEHDLAAALVEGLTFGSRREEGVSLLRADEKGIFQELIRGIAVIPQNGRLQGANDIPFGKRWTQRNFFEPDFNPGFWPHVRCQFKAKVGQQGLAVQGSFGKRGHAEFRPVGLDLWWEGGQQTFVSRSIPQCGASADYGIFGLPAEGYEHLAGIDHMASQNREFDQVATF
ncbi:MAG: hypothetical protein CME16_01860 [Gemmatimonadetes bacterium]|nr:hypothetical protein [Gemmatimonadota bacterium]